jgi:hypothetical protein
VASRCTTDTARVDSLNTKWGANADDISVFLNSANPKNWPTATLKSMMHTHLDQTLSEATHQLKGDYGASVKDFDDRTPHSHDGRRAERRNHRPVPTEVHEKQMR